MNSTDVIGIVILMSMTAVAMMMLNEAGKAFSRWLRKRSTDG